MTTPRVTVPVENLRAELHDHLIAARRRKSLTVPKDLGRRLLSALSAAPAPEGGAVEGPGDYTMVLTVPQAFERFPALASHIERMAVGRSVGSLIEWDGFLRELNAALATREEAPAEAGEPKHFAAFMAEDGALRAQPPAREDAQPVAWLDAAQKKAVERAAMDAGAYSWRNARLAMVEGDKIIGYPAFSRADMAELSRLHTHPAPDALRVAAIAFRDAVSADGPATGDRYAAWVAKARAARADLDAALQAEQGAK